MLLNEYLRSVPGYTGSLGTATNTGSVLRHIDYFEFGDQYAIRLISGKTFVFLGLEDLLDVMRGEFEEAKLMPFMRMESPRTKSDPLGQRTRRLVVNTKRPNDPDMWGGMDAFVDRIRSAVTMYNLTQSWDQFSKGNL